MSKTKPPQRGAPRPLPPALRSALDEAEGLMRAKHWEDAGEMLADLDARYPQRREVLAALARLQQATEDLHAYEATCMRLLEVEPDDAGTMLALAGVQIEFGRPLLALRTLREFIAHWPEHPRAAGARGMLAALEADRGTALAALSLPAGDEGFAAGLLHEETQAWLESGELERARAAVEQLLRARPDFAFAYNNLGQLEFAAGRLDQAIALSERVLAMQPDNYYALSNLVRYRLLSGRLEEARATAERLKSVLGSDLQLCTRQAEAYSYVGDDEAVLQTLRRAVPGEAHGAAQEPPSEWALLEHLVAVAEMRLGRAGDARELWQSALAHDPELEIAAQNLADLRRPAGQQHGPWAFEMSNFVVRQTFEDMLAEVEPAVARDDGTAIAHASRRFLRKHPEMAAILPVMLDRGDPPACEFALNLAIMAGTPELMEIVRQFALGTRGRDEWRRLAATHAALAGLLPAGPLRLWIEGAWREIFVPGFEVHDEKEPPHPGRIRSIMQKAADALARRDGAEAESLIRRALEMQRDVLPSVWNKLAAAVEMQGRAEQADDIRRELLARHANEPLARAILARHAAEGGKLDEARELLAPLLARKRFHVDEFAALGDAYLTLLLADKQLDMARQWYEMWAEIDPDSPALLHWRRQLRTPDRTRRRFGPRLDAPDRWS